jgi:homopolymeric O-antigen transport system permease protein
MSKKRYLNLLREIAVCEFKLKDQSTVLGLFWSFLNPVIMLLVLLLFFHLNTGKDIPNYGMYLLIGIIHYTHFSNSTNAAMATLSGMRELTANVMFPKEVLVMGSILSNTIEFAITMTIAAAIEWLSGVTLTWTVLLLPLVIGLQALTVLWLSLVLSCLHVFVRDVSHIYQVFLRLLFFVTPIFYAPSYVGDSLARRIVEINPLAQLIRFSRLALIEGTPFPGSAFGLLLGLNAVAIVVTLAVFRSYESKFAEYV